MKKITLALLLALTSPLHAYQYTDGSISIFSDLLIWKLGEGGADNWAQEISPADTIRTVDLLNVPFKWDAGFRVGLGYNSPDNCWDTVLYYTRFQTSSNRAASVSSGGVYSGLLGNQYIDDTNGAAFGPNYYAADMEWKLSFNTVDLEFGREFEIDPILTLRPFVGIKSAFINQKLNSTWQTPTVPTTFTSATEYLKYDYWGIGPSIGLDSTWPFYQTRQSRWNLFGNVSGAFMWGHWSFSEAYENNTPARVTINFSDLNGATTMARGLMGIQWDACCFGSDVTVRLAYEAQIWFDQLQYYSLSMGRLNHLMSLQGGILDFYFNF